MAQPVKRLVASISRSFEGLHGEQKHSWIAMCIVIAAYILVFVWLPSDVFWSPDEGAKFLQMNSISWQNGPQFQIVYSGVDTDPEFVFYPKGYPLAHIYPQKSDRCNVRYNWPIWFPLISYIPYFLAGIRGLYLIPLISGLGIVFISGRIAHRIHPKVAPLTILVVGLASPIIFYSVLFWEHTFTVLLGLLAFYLAFRLLEHPHPRLNILAIGVLLIISTSIRIEMAVFAVSLFAGFVLAMLVSYRGDMPSSLMRELPDHWWRWLVITASFATLIYFLLFAYPPQENSLSSYCSDHRPEEYTRNILDQVRTIYRSEDPFEDIFSRDQGFLINGVNAIGLVWYFGLDIKMSPIVAWLGLSGILLCGLGAVIPGRRGEYVLILGMLLLVFCTTYILLLTTRYRFVHGVFLPAPYLVLSGLFLVYNWRSERYQVRLLALVTTIYFILGTVAVILRLDPFYTIAPEWGARYMLIIYPLMAICATLAIFQLKIGQSSSFRATSGSLKLRYLFQVSAAALFVLGLLFSTRALTELHTTKADLKAYQSAISESMKPVVSDLFWFPASLAPYFVNHEMYTLQEEASLENWIEQMDGLWSSFLFASFDEPAIEHLNNNKDFEYQLSLKNQHLVNGLLVSEIVIKKKKE